MRVGPRCPGGVAEAVAAGAPGMPAEVGAAGSKAARTASDAGGGFVATGAGLGFFAEVVALEGFFAELCEADALLELFVDLDEDLLEGFAEDFAEDFVDGLLLLLELDGLAVLFEDFAGGLLDVSSGAAKTCAGSAMQQAIVDKSATTRRTVRPRMGWPSANRRPCAPVNALAPRIPLANPCVAGWSMCGGVVAGGCFRGVTAASRRLHTPHRAPGRKSFRTACDHPRSHRRRRRTWRSFLG